MLKRSHFYGGPLVPRRVVLFSYLRIFFFVSANFYFVFAHFYFYFRFRFFLFPLKQNEKKHFGKTKIQMCKNKIKICRNKEKKFAKTKIKQLWVAPADKPFGAYFSQKEQL